MVIIRVFVLFVWKEYDGEIESLIQKKCKIVGFK